MPERFTADLPGLSGLESISISLEVFFPSAAIVLNPCILTVPYLSDSHDNNITHDTEFF